MSLNEAPGGSRTCGRLFWGVKTRLSEGTNPDSRESDGGVPLLEEGGLGWHGNHPIFCYESPSSRGKTSPQIWVELKVPKEGGFSSGSSAGRHGFGKAPALPRLDSRRRMLVPWGSGRANVWKRRHLHVGNQSCFLESCLRMKSVVSHWLGSQVTGQVKVMEVMEISCSLRQLP